MSYRNPTLFSYAAFHIPTGYGNENSLILTAQELRAVNNCAHFHSAWVGHFGLSERLITSHQDVKAQTYTGRFSAISLAVANEKDDIFQLKAIRR